MQDTGIKYENIAILFAMQDEAKLFLEQTNFAEVTNPHSKLPILQTEKKWNNSKVHVFCNGTDPQFNCENVGCEAATLSTLYILDNYKVDLLINAGTAGAYKKNAAQIGDVFTSKEKIYFHDHRIAIPSYEKFGRGELKTASINSYISKELNLKQATISTGSSLDLQKEDQKIMDSYGAEIKEMEAAAIQRVASYYNKPVLYLKSVTDFLDASTPTPEQFNTHLEQATSQLAISLNQCIDFLSKK